MFNKILSLLFVTVTCAFMAFSPSAVDAASSTAVLTESSDCRITAAGATVRRVQAKVGVAQDGVLGPVTCNAIKSYQCTKNLPVDGIVGSNTWGIMQGNTPPRGVRICADLRNQRLWLSKDGVQTYTAVRMRSGDPTLSQSEPTRVGNHRVYYKDIDHISSIFGSPMPYSMFFYGGQAIHESTFSTPGSHGCINVTHDDAKKLWNNSPVGTPVSVWGARRV